MNIELFVEGEAPTGSVGAQAGPFLMHYINEGQWPGAQSWQKADLLSEELRAAHLVVASAAETEEVLGFVSLRTAVDHWDITLLLTNPNKLRQGVMKALFQWLETNLEGPEELWLEVHAHNERAKSFYKKLGFQYVGRRPNYYGKGLDAELFTYLFS